MSFYYDEKVRSFFHIIMNDYFDAFFRGITPFFVLVILLFVIPTILLWKHHKKRWILLLWISGLCAGLVSIILKNSVQRPRPGQELLMWGIKDYSFPSTHAMVACAVMPFLCALYPRQKWLWVSITTIIIFSRLYLDVHYLSDVLFGSLFGYGIAWGVLYINDKYFHQRPWNTPTENSN